MDDSLKYQAETLGIKVDGRWSDERLQKEIDEALAKAPAPFGGKGDHDGDGKPGGSVKTLPFRINRDFWDEAGARHRKDTIVEMTAEEALDGLESGALSRVK